MKRYMMLLVFLVPSFALQAQSAITVVAGVASAKFSTELDGATYDETSTRQGVAVGIGVQHRLNSMISLAPELLYVVKGGKSSRFDETAKVVYLEVPLVFRYSFETGGSATPFLLGGPSVSYMLSCEVTDQDGDVDICDDLLESSDFGIMVGAGVQLDRFGVSLRYEAGLRDFQSAERFVAKHRTVFLLASFAL